MMIILPVNVVSIDFFICNLGQVKSHCLFFLFFVPFSLVNFKDCNYYFLKNSISTSLASDYLVSVFDHLQ